MSMSTLSLQELRRECLEWAQTLAARHEDLSAYLNQEMPPPPETCPYSPAFVVCVCVRACVCVCVWHMDEFTGRPTTLHNVSVYVKCLSAECRCLCLAVEIHNTYSRCGACAKTTDAM